MTNILIKSPSDDMFDCWGQWSCR